MFWQHLPLQGLKAVSYTHLTSKIARDKNNIYGYKAYDSDPYGFAGTFRSIPECIIYVSAYIRSAYLSEDGRYFYGPNLNGMNTKYASDPMWKVKIANIMEGQMCIRDSPGLEGTLCLRF